MLVLFRLKLSSANAFCLEKSVFFLCNKELNFFPIFTGFQSPEGIAIDFLSRNMYVTDSGLDVIAVANLNGTYKKTLISENLDDPRAIVLDPQRGFVDITLSQTSPCFVCVYSVSLLKTLWEKKKLLITSNWSFSHSVFYQFGELSFVSIKLKIVVCTLSVWKNLKFVVLKKIKDMFLQPERKT